MGDQCLEVFGNGIGNWGDMGYSRIWDIAGYGERALPSRVPMLRLPRGLIEEGGVIYYEGSGLPSLNVFI